MKLPGRCHPLLHNRKGQWAIDLDHPKRLVFEPVGNPLPIYGEDRLDLDKITAIKIIAVEDYHGK